MLSAWAIYRFARGRRAATILLLGVLVLDLAVWGQSSGWRMASPPRDFELWSEPDTVVFCASKSLRKATRHIESSLKINRLILTFR